MLVTYVLKFQDQQVYFELRYQGTVSLAWEYPQGDRLSQNSTFTAILKVID